MEHIASLVQFAQASTYQYSSGASTSTSDPNTFMAAFLITFGITFFLYAIPTIIVTWNLFRKAGKPGWGAIIPVYNSMLMAEIAGKPVWMGVLAGVCSLLGVIPFIGFLFSIAALVFLIIILVDFIPKYQASTGFWVAFILLPLIAAFMVKKVSYRGTPSFGGQAFQPENTQPQAFGETVQAPVGQTDQAPQQPQEQPQNPQNPQNPNTPPTV